MLQIYKFQFNKTSNKVYFRNKVGHNYIKVLNMLFPNISFLMVGLDWLNSVWRHINALVATIPARVNTRKPNVFLIV